MTQKGEAELKEYLEAYNTYHDRLSEYVTVGAVVPGQPLQLPKKVLTMKASKELDELSKKVEEKRKAWVKAIGL